MVPVIYLLFHTVLNSFKSSIQIYLIIVSPDVCLIITMNYNFVNFIITQTLFILVISGIFATYNIKINACNSVHQRPTKVINIECRVFVKSNLMKKQMYIVQID